MTDLFNCNEVGKLSEFVECKLDRDNGKLRITKPVLMQSFADEFDLLEGPTPVTPAEPGMVLMNSKEDEAIDAASQLMYWSGFGKLIHMMKWSRPEVLNAVKDLTRHMSVATLCLVMLTVRIYHVQCVVVIAPLIRGNSRGRANYNLAPW